MIKSPIIGESPEIMMKDEEPAIAAVEDTIKALAPDLHPKKVVEIDVSEYLHGFTRLCNRTPALL